MAPHERVRLEAVHPLALSFTVRFLDQTDSNTVTIVESQNDPHVAITTEGKLHTSQFRAVIIFFMDSAELEEYLATSYNGALSWWSLLKEKKSH